ncbi:MAG: LysM domain-containing protein [Kiritimatiellae bacterium]|nr:LysM domain-containing protein [Kiritimatiellia bacterium]
MSLQRGAFGIEYNSRPKESDSGAVMLLLIVIAVIALISFGVSLYRRGKVDAVEETARIEAEESVSVQQPMEVERSLAEVQEAEEEALLPPAPVVEIDKFGNRPAKVRNLLMRLEEAEKRKDIEMAVSTIEQLRSIPGNPVADIDDALARRLGTLNVLWLFDRNNAQWVKEVVVRSGSNASRIAAENGATLASLEKLNGNIDTVFIGQKLKVLDHPRFNLVIHRRSRTADLSLNGKFFKRYDLVDEVTGKDGMYEVTPPYRQFWRDLGTIFPRADRIELETLMPKGSSVIISEF